jgi:hypothetical protein
MLNLSLTLQFVTISSPARQEFSMSLSRNPANVSHDKACTSGTGDRFRGEQWHEFQKKISAANGRVCGRFAAAVIGGRAGGRGTKIELDGIHHRGIDDARNMVKLLPYALGRKHLKLN